MAVTRVHLQSTKEPWLWSWSQLCQMFFEIPLADAAKAAMRQGQMERCGETARTAAERTAGAAWQLLPTSGTCPGKAEL